MKFDFIGNSSFYVFMGNFRMQKIGQDSHNMRKYVKCSKYIYIHKYNIQYINI